MIEEDKLFLYENLNEETKKIINKAIDINEIIKDKDITKIVKDCIDDYEKYSFTKFDKRIFSIFMACYITDTSLKTTLDNYDDFDIENLYSFVDIDKNELEPEKEKDYETLYKENFLLDLVTSKKASYINFDEMTPQILFLFLKEITISGSEILNYFVREYSSVRYSYRLKCFEAVETSAKLSGNLHEKNSNKFSGRRDFLPLPSIGKIDLFPLDLHEETEELPEEKDEEVPTEDVKINLDDEKIWQILEKIQKKFIGQEVAAEYLFYNIVNNQHLANNKDSVDGQRSIIFLDGPTGTGKTAITREITKELDIPFVSTSITNYSSTGYVGGDLTDTLKSLLEKAEGDLEKAERGIIVFDEFDKIASNNERGLEMRKAVQQQLLDFMGGGKYTVRIGGGFFSHSIEFDTSKLTFVCLGALSDLREEKQQRKQTIGFGEETVEHTNNSYSITPQDLMNLGLERELVGRFNTYIHTEEYSKDALLKILKESTISPIIGFENWISSRGKKLQIEDGVYETIAESAYELHTGARSLQTVMNNIRTPFLKEVLRGQNEVISLSASDVKKISEDTMNRKGVK